MPDRVTAHPLAALAELAELLVPVCLLCACAIEHGCMDGSRWISMGLQYKVLQERRRGLLNGMDARSTQCWQLAYYPIMTCW